MGTFNGMRQRSRRIVRNSTRFLRFLSGFAGLLYGVRVEGPKLSKPLCNQGFNFIQLSIKQIHFRVIEFFKFGHF